MLAIALPTTVVSRARVYQILRTTQFDTAGERPYDWIQDYFANPQAYIDKRIGYTVSTSLPLGNRFTAMAASIFELVDDVPKAIANGMLLEAYDQQRITPLDVAPAIYRLSLEAIETILSERNVPMLEWITTMVQSFPIPDAPVVYRPTGQRKANLHIELPRPIRHKLLSVSRMLMTNSTVRRDSVALDYIVMNHPIWQKLQAKEERRQQALERAEEKRYQEALAQAKDATEVLEVPEVPHV